MQSVQLGTNLCIIISKYVCGLFTEGCFWISESKTENQLRKAEVQSHKEQADEVTQKTFS